MKYKWYFQKNIKAGTYRTLFSIYTGYNVEDKKFEIDFKIWLFEFGYGPDFNLEDIIYTNSNFNHTD